ncbi:MAG: helix-turn-helix domain-containing protein [Bacilli bacterium]|nr:helix-turn-helix domain-containing protein [Bacilli bacterium]
MNRKDFKIPWVPEFLRIQITAFPTIDIDFQVNNLTRQSMYFCLGINVIGGIAMTTDYSYLRDEYPEIISQDQLYRICRISKRKATWILENGYIPCKDSGKKTRRFKIQIDDVIIYLTKLEKYPESLQTPPGIFSSRTKFRSIKQMQEPIDSDKFMIMLKKRWSSSPDALTVDDTVKLTGYCKTTVSEWIAKKKLFGVWYYNKYLIPKDCLIEYMATKAHRICQKSQKHIDLLRQFQKL